MFDQLNGLDVPQRTALVLIVRLLSLIIVFQWINLLHHWVVIGLKWWIYKIVRNFLEEAAKDQDRLSISIDEMRETVLLLKTWYELNRIQTSRQRQIGDEMKESIEQAVGHTDKKIDQIPDKVVDKIESSKSGMFPKPSGPTGEVQ